MVNPIHVSSNSHSSSSLHGLASTEATPPSELKDTSQQPKLPPSARRPLVIKNLIKTKPNVFFEKQATPHNFAGRAYLSADKLQGLSGDQAIDLILDSLLEQHSELLSEDAKTAISGRGPGGEEVPGRLREYLSRLVANAAMGEHLLGVFNQFLGVVLSGKNGQDQKKVALESILALPREELMCLAGTHERISMAMHNLSAASNLPGRLHISVIDKLFSKIEQGSQGLPTVNQIHRRSDAMNGRFLLENADSYEALMVQEINDLISKDIEPLIASMEKVVYEGDSQAVDTYLALKKLGEEKAEFIALFHPHIRDGSPQELSPKKVKLDPLHQTKAYFGEEDENTSMPVRVNRDQIYSNFFSRLREYIDPVSKIAIVMSNPECAVGLANGIFTADQKQHLGFSTYDLLMSRGQDFISMDQNNALIEKIRQRLPVYLEQAGDSVSTLLDHNLIDVVALANSNSVSQDLQELLILPLLAKNISIDRMGAADSGITVSSYLDAVSVLKMPALSQAAFKMYVCAACQGLTGAELLKFKHEIYDQCTQVRCDDFTALERFEKIMEKVEVARSGNMLLAGDIVSYLLVNDFPDGPLRNLVLDRLESAVFQGIKSSNDFQSALRLLSTFKNFSQIERFADACCALLNNSGLHNQSQLANRAVSQLLDLIESHLIKGAGSAHPEQVLKVIATVAQTMGQFRAAKLCSSVRDIAQGGLTRSQDPQTRAYKLIKRYLMSQTQDEQLKLPFLKNLWAGDAIGQFSDATRSLSAGHWKKIITSLASNSVLYGLGYAGVELAANSIGDSLNAVLEKLDGFDVNTGKDLYALKQKNEQTIQDSQALIVAIEEEQVQMEGQASQMVSEYQNNGQQSELNEFVRVVVANNVNTDSPVLGGIILNRPRDVIPDWSEASRASLSPGAQQIFDRFAPLAEEYRANQEERDETRKLLRKCANDQVLLDQQVQEFETLKAQNQPNLIEQQQLNNQLETVNKVAVAMPAVAEGAALVLRGAVGAAGKLVAAVDKEAKSWGPMGASKTLRTLYKASQENPLASVHDAAVRLTPLAILQCVKNAKSEPERLQKIEGAKGVWKQILTSLENSDVRLKSDQKAKLVVDFLKHFSNAGQFGMNSADSREAVYSMFDSLDSTNFLKTGLPDIRRFSKSASVTVMQYFIEKHDAAIRNSQPDGRLSAQELQQFNQLLGVKQHIQPAVMVDRSKLAANKLQQNLRPAWASSAVVAAALTGKPVTPALEAVRGLRDQRTQNLQGKLDASQALYERMRRG